jgi:glycosyltransferase involved in cell wall biosynthesis
MSKKRIGFLSYWGLPRGLSYVTLCYAKMIKDDYDVYILKQFSNPISKEFDIKNINITEYPDYLVKRDFFVKWVKENKLDAVVFNEYKQWNKDPNELIQACKEIGVKTYGVLAFEKFKPEQAMEYDRVLARSVSAERLMRKHKIRHFTYVPYSIDLDEFDEHKVAEHKKFRFFHPGGMGGVGNRKNTYVVIEAFEMLDPENTELIITSQKPLQFNREIHPNIKIIDKNLSRKELIDYYYESDAVVLPSKWESIGIPILEALAAGKPVVTTDVAPMNEFIRNCLNGYLCHPLMVNYADISIPVAEIDPIELKKKMEMMLTPITYDIVKKNARHIAEEIYDLEKNKKYFLDFLKEDLK